MAQVLVAEDEMITALDVVDHLEDLGHTVRDACDGAAAMEVLEDFEPDVIVTDLMMPNVDGYEFIRRVRRRDGPPVPIIVITAVPQARLPADLGYNEYVAKPVNHELLARLVARLSANGR